MKKIKQMNKCGSRIAQIIQINGTMLFIANAYYTCVCVSVRVRHKTDLVAIASVDQINAYAYCETYA